MYMDGPIAAERAGAAGLVGAGAGLRGVAGWGALSRLGSGSCAVANSSFCLFHTRPFSLIAFMSARTKVWNPTRCTLGANRVFTDNLRTCGRWSGKFYPAAGGSLAKDAS
jgi:hypothetical protein